MAPHELIKVHCNVLIVQLGPHYVISVLKNKFRGLHYTAGSEYLQETGEAEEHEERVAVSKLRRRRQPTRISVDIHLNNSI